MFPPADVVFNYPTNIAHSFALIGIMLIPDYIWLDRRRDDGLNFGIILRLFTRTPSVKVESLCHVCSRLVGCCLDKRDSGSVYDRP